MDDAKRHLSNLDDLYLLVGTPWMRLSLLLRPEPVVRQNEVVLISKPALCRTRETGCVSRRVVNLLPLGTYTAMQSDHQPTINQRTPHLTTHIPSTPSEGSAKYHTTGPTTCPAGTCTMDMRAVEHDSSLVNISGSCILHMQIPDVFWNISQIF
jgi:hypothetical protein